MEKPNLNNINQILILALVIVFVVVFIGVLNKVTTQTKEKILTNIVYFFSSLAIIGGILILKSCYNNWEIIRIISTADAIVLMSGVLLFSAGLLGLVFQTNFNKK